MIIKSQYLYIAIFIIFIIAVGWWFTASFNSNIFFSLTEKNVNSVILSELDPAAVVNLYFNSWNKRDYATMYALISDGFKKIDPIAGDLISFSAEMDKYFENAKDIQIISAKITSQTDKKATVEYTIEMGLFNGPLSYESVYSFKKQSDGWKLIHPYGGNIDMSE